MTRHENAGYRVVTQSGKKGRTYHRKELINGKIQVFLDDGAKLLCDSANLKIIGYID